MNDIRYLTPPINDAASLASSHPNRADRAVDAARMHPAHEAIALTVISHSRLLREGFVSLIAPYLSVRLVGSYTGNTAPNDQMSNPHVHVVLIDSGIGKETVILWTRWWRAHPVPARVLVMEVEDNKDVILAYIEIGANGYTLKEAPPAEVAQAIWYVSQGLAQCSPEVTAYLFARLAALSAMPSLPAPAPMPLTTREMDVLRCLAQGMSNKEIAAALVIEIYTVKHHVHNILEKLKTRHRYEAVRLAAEQGWVAESERYPHSTLSI
jgi:DNA-binding NarL/FixJ family response regulator